VLSWADAIASRAGRCCRGKGPILAAHRGRTRLAVPLLVLPKLPMRLRHDVLKKALAAPAGPPLDGRIRRTCMLQLSVHGLLLAHGLAAHIHSTLIGGLWLSVGVTGMCVLCVCTAWRSRLAFAQLMMPIAALHLLLSAMHLAPLARPGARQRFGWLGLAPPTVLHGLSLYLAVRAAGAVAAAAAAAARDTGAPRRRRPPAPFMRLSQSHQEPSRHGPAPARSGMARRSRAMPDSASGMLGAGMMSAPPLVPPGLQDSA
jgi:hypothetical protein